MEGGRGGMGEGGGRQERKGKGGKMEDREGKEGNG